MAIPIQYSTCLKHNLVGISIGGPNAGGDELTPGLRRLTWALMKIGFALRLDTKPFTFNTTLPGIGCFVQVLVLGTPAPPNLSFSVTGIHGYDDDEDGDNLKCIH